MNDSSGAQWRDGGRRAQKRVKGSNGEESTYAGQDEDKHIVWVWAGKFSGGDGGDERLNHGTVMESLLQTKWIV